MHARYRSITILLSLLLAAPAALASWGALSTVEPDTALDATGDYMYTEPNRDASAKKVYFNVVATAAPTVAYAHGVPGVPTGTGRTTATNPNVGALGTDILPVGGYTFDAFFGVWVDCNKDGYIGMAEGALFEYRSELLPADHVCPAQTGGHNEQSWVSELKWIGYPQRRDANGVPTPRDARLLWDAGADIWGDRNVPGTSISVNTNEQCLVRYSSTGGALNYLDCVSARNVGAANEGLSLLGLGFPEGSDGKTDWNAAHPLNVGTFGDKDSNQRAATVWDCSAGKQGVQSGMGHQDTGYLPKVSDYQFALQVTDEEGYVNVSLYQLTNGGGTAEPYDSDVVRVNPKYWQPAPSLGPGGSIAGAWNHTGDGGTAERNEVFLVAGVNPTGDCDSETHSRAASDDLYFQETVKDVRVPSKSRVDVSFSFYEEQRNGAGKRGEPFDRGVYPVARAGLALFAGSSWQANNVYTDSMPPLARATIEPAPGVVAEGSRYFTFYANLTSESFSKGLQTPQSSPGIYGDEWCHGTPSGVANGFNCNPDEWYLEADGTRATGNTFNVFAGHAYYLRDIDCYDYRITEGVHASGAMVDPSTRCQ